MGRRTTLLLVWAVVALVAFAEGNAPARVWSEATDPTVTRAEYDCDACRVVWTHPWGETSRQRVFSFEVY